MNQHIKEYLKYYITLTRPQYAVLLIGKWGSGKTHFIKNLINEWKEPEFEADEISMKPIYVSLAGIKEAKTINEKIRMAINPFLYSKGVKVAKSVLAGLIKTTTKIDINYDEDDKPDGSLSYSIDLLGIFDSDNQKIKGNKILIFDDVERCKMATDEIFGYINYFVEHTDSKVILLADEDKIRTKYTRDSTGDDPEYKDFKEKLIGQTFLVQSDIIGASKSFLKEMKEINDQLDIEQHQNLIVKLFEASKLQNLRVLKQSLLDFSRLLSFLDSNLQGHAKYDEFIKSFLSYFIIIYIELKTGNDEIREYQSFWSAVKSEDDQKRIADQKYNYILEEFEVSHSYFVFPIDYYIEYIENGFLSKEVINNKLKTNHFFGEEKLQNWEKLWGWRKLNDKDFNSLKIKVWNEFRKGDMRYISVVLHVAGIFICLIEEGLLNKKKSFVVRHSKQILKKIIEGNSSDVENEVEYDFMDNSSRGKQYQSIDSPEFKDIKSYTLEIISAKQKEEKKRFARVLFEGLTEQSLPLLREKLKELLPNNSNTYEKTSILSDVNGKKLGRRIIGLSNEAIFSFRRFIHYRYYPEETYSNVILEQYHKEEMNCLLELQNELEKGISSRKPIRAKVLGALIDELKKIIIKLKSIT